MRPEVLGFVVGVILGLCTIITLAVFYLVYLTKVAYPKDTPLSELRQAIQLVGLGCYAGLLTRLAEEDAWLETVIDHLMLERDQRYEERRVAIHMSAKNGVAPPFGRILSEIRSTATGGER